MAVVNSKVYAIVKSPPLSATQRQPSSDELIAAHQLACRLLKDKAPSYCLPERTLLTGADIVRDANRAVDARWVAELVRHHALLDAREMDKVCE